MNKKFLGGLGIGIVIAIIAITAYGLTNESSNGTTLEITPNEKLGLVINSPSTSTTLQTLDKIYSEASQTGIGRSNVYMFWNLVEPEKGQYNWEQFDPLMSLNKKNDLKVTLYFSLINGKTIGPFPDWMGRPQLDSISDSNTVQVLDAVLTRYPLIDYLIIAGETDSHFRYVEQEIPVYQELFDSVYSQLKEKHPNVKIGNAFSLHGVLNKNLEHIITELSDGDFVAFTYFPVDTINEINKNPTEAKEDLEQIFNLVPDKKIAIFEISWSTSDFVGGTSNDQREFLEHVFDFYSENQDDIEFVTWYRQYDRPANSCKIDPQTVETPISITEGSGKHSLERLENYICSAGLIKNDGNPKPAWEEFGNQIRRNTNS